MWIWLVLVYGLIKGIREILKKKALEKSTALEVLFLYTFISFLIVTPEAVGAFDQDFSTLPIVAFKSFCIFLAWIFGFNSLKNIPVGIYSLLDLARVIFTTGLGVVVLGERLGVGEIVGCTLVCIGLLLLKFKPGMKNSDKALPGGPKGNTQERENVSTVFVILTLGSAFLNAVSGMLDKYILFNTSMKDGHLQFWYMLFLVLYYLLLVCVCKLAGALRSKKAVNAAEKGNDRALSDNKTVNKDSIAYQMSSFNLKSALKNYWIWILAILFVIADRCLFIANADPDSKVSIMTLIKQSCVLVTILAGRFIFHEKELLRKLISAAIVVSGIMISILL